RAHAAPHRAAPHHACLPRADDVRAAAAPARGGEAQVRPELDAIRELHRLALPAARQARDDRMVGAGDPRGLRLERARLHDAAGRPLAGVQIRILDEDGRELPQGQAGLIYVHQPTLTDFTYNDNDAARRGMERDGYLTMGDVGYLDEDGFLFIVDRSADMVIS